MSEKCIRIWHWLDAPEEYRELVGHGGDEDWVVHCPAAVVMYHWPLNLEDVLHGDEDSYVQRWGHVERVELANGDVVVCFAHA